MIDTVAILGSCALVIYIAVRAARLDRAEQGSKRGQRPGRAAAEEQA